MLSDEEAQIAAVQHRRYYFVSGRAGKPGSWAVACAWLVGDPVRLQWHDGKNMRTRSAIDAIRGPIPGDRGLWNQDQQKLVSDHDPMLLPLVWSI